MRDLKKPTNFLVKKYINIFNNDERYFSADQAIKKLFNSFPENKNIEDVLLKISVINDLYSTNILGTYKMAQHIHNLSIDKGLTKGDPLIVNKIASGHGITSRKNNREIRFYSFATKYCNWHNIEEYALYDTYVEKTLIAYKMKDSFDSFTKSDLKNFPKFKQTIKNFIEYYNLSNINLKEIDKFLWMYGKEKFPTYYRN